MKLSAIIIAISSICFSLSGFAQQATTTTSASGITQVKMNVPEFNADKWYRNSAERNAIYREVFFLAENVIKQRVVQEKLQPQQWGVTLDIDETTLDNSVWNYRHDILGKQQTWNEFAAQAISIPLPGVKQFINDIHQMGGYINLVSNRPSTLQAATEKNLKQQGIYFDQVLLDATNVGTSFVDKNPRFKAIVQGAAPSKLPAQKVLAWFGDNIQDFPDLKQAQMIKKDPNGKAYEQFGVTDFALPNPMYGSWEINMVK
jgi:5'-nucleotidase (lipoprotein e(P4) family)